jgi:sulfate adenylyltransferase
MFLRSGSPAVTERTGTGSVVLLTGLSGAGKTTIARSLADMLAHEWARSVTVLDGDQIRQWRSPELGFSRADRLLHLQRMGAMAADVARRGGIAVCAAIAPFAEGRDVMRAQAQAVGTFVVVHVATPLHICEARDSKQLYARARAGLLDHFTGVSDPYEVPDSPDLAVDTADISAAVAAGLVVSRLIDSGCLGPVTGRRGLSASGRL